MLTKLNTYEGVPIGRDNFDEYMYYIRSFLGANFSFSVNAINDGGYFSDGGFNWNLVSATPGPGSQKWLFLPGSLGGSIFGRDETREFYRFDVSSDYEFVERWELLATQATSTGGYTFSFNEAVLPYGPLRYYDAADRDKNYAEGFNYVTYNGIPQPYFTYSVNRTYSAPATSTLSANKLRMGAEAIEPVAVTGEYINGRYGYYTDNPSSTGGMMMTYVGLPVTFNNRVKFPFTNFSLDYGSHILLRRDVGAKKYFAYVPQDLTSGTSVASGHYKVVDYATGEIELNISVAQLNLLVDSTDSFINDSAKFSTMKLQILSAEQLEETSLNGVTSYHTKYTYDGDAANVLLVAYSFDGQNNVVTEIPSDVYISAGGTTLFQDASQQYTDSVVLALSYNIKADPTIINEVQSRKYQPDVLQLYYFNGLLYSAANTSTNIRMVIQHNPVSWYNRDILDADYYPVARAQESHLAYVLLGEVVTMTYFDPDHQFQITDTIDLKDLGDVYGKGGTDLFNVASSANTDGTVLQFNYASSKFIATDYLLSALDDVNVAGVTNNQVLAYNSSTQKWEAVSYVSNLGFTPLARTGGSSPTDYTVTSGRRLYYTDTMPAGGGYSTTMLTSKQFVDESIANHNNVTAAHSATSSATANRIMLRDGSGRVNVASPPSNDDTSTLAATAQWVMSTRASATAAPNQLLKADPSGYVRITPAGGGYLGDSPAMPVIQHNVLPVSVLDLLNWTNVAPLNDHILQRDSAGRGFVTAPTGSDPSGIVNVSYFNNTLLETDINSSNSYGYVTVGNIRLAWVTASIAANSWAGGQVRSALVYFGPTGSIVPGATKNGLLRPESVWHTIEYDEELNGARGYIVSSLGKDYGQTIGHYVVWLRNSSTSTINLPNITVRVYGIVSVSA